MEFDTGFRTLFQIAVDNEFLALEEKAGLSVAVYTDQKLWTYATGEADNNVKMMVDTPLMVSSSSKTFLSALILSQIEMGLYGLTDSVGTVLENHPDFPSFELDKVNPEATIEQMLTMSSGMADFSYNMVGKKADLTRNQCGPRLTRLTSSNPHIQLLVPSNTTTRMSFSWESLRSFTPRNHLRTFIGRLF